jgi:hypothetical protein
MNNPAAFRPVAIKFKQLLEEIKRGYAKRTAKLFASFAKSRFPPGCPPYLAMIEASIAFHTGYFGSALLPARQAESQSDDQMVLQLLVIFRKTNSVADLRALYTRLRKMKPMESQFGSWDLVLDLCLGEFRRAQECSPALVKLENKPDTLSDLAT